MIVQLLLNVAMASGASEYNISVYDRPGHMWLIEICRLDRCAKFVVDPKNFDQVKLIKLARKELDYED